MWSCLITAAGPSSFSLLPKAASVAPALFEALFLTPPAVDLGQVAAGLAVEVRTVSTPEALAAGLAARMEAPWSPTTPVVLWRWQQGAAEVVGTVGRARKAIADAATERLSGIFGDLAPGC